MSISPMTADSRRVRSLRRWTGLACRLGPGLALLAGLSAPAGCSRGGSEVPDPDVADLSGPVTDRDLGGADLGGGSDLGAPPQCPAPCWINPLPQGNPLSSLWRDAAGDGWAVGLGPSLVRIEGGRARLLRTTLTDKPTYFYSVWGTGPGDVWVVGQSTVLHYDGTAWAQSAIDTSGYLSLYGVWGPSARDVWAVGSQGAIRRYDGATWQKVTSPTTKALRSVHGTSDKQAFAVGDSGALVRWDGTSWKLDPLTTINNLRRVRCAAPNDCLAVGESGAALRWDGARWTELKTSLYDSFFGLVAFGPADYLLTASSISGPSTFRFDGKTFTKGSTDGLFLYDVAGPSPSDLWGAGAGGTLASSNGLSWTAKGSGSLEILTAAFALAPTDVWIAGAGYSPTNTVPHMLHWDGARLVAYETPARAVYQSVWGSGPKDVFAVGSQGAMARWDGASWSAQPKLTTEELYAVHGTGPAQVFAVGTRGVVLRYDGKAWMTVPAPVPETLRALWLTASDGWAVGGTSTAGVLVRFDGSRGWTPWPKRFGKQLAAVWGSGPRDVWAGGDEGLLIHFDGTEWSEVTSPVTSDIQALAGSGASDVWMTAFGGSAHRWDGTRWRPVPTDTRHTLSGLVNSGGQVIAVGESGTVLRLAP